MPLQATTILTAIGALSAVLALIWLGQWVARARGFPTRLAEDRRVAVVETTPLDSRRKLCLVRCEGSRVLVMVGGAQDLVVGWLPDNEAGG